MLTDYSRTPQHKAWRVSALRYQSCFMRKGWRTDIMKRIDVFTIFAEAPKTGSYSQCGCPRSRLSFKCEWRNLLSVCRANYWHYRWSRLVHRPWQHHQPHVCSSLQSGTTSLHILEPQRGGEYILHSNKQPAISQHDSKLQILFLNAPMSLKQTWPNVLGS
jgi:hypothetical protein